MKSDIESLLARDLRELAAPRSFEPDLDAITRRGRVVRRRRIALASIGGSAVAAAAAAIALVITTAGQAGLAARPASTEAGTPPTSRTTTAGPSPVSTPATPPSAAELSAQLTVAMTKAQATSKITVLMAVGDGSDQVITVPSQKWKEDVTRNSSGVETQVRFAYEVPGIVSTGPDKGDSVLKIFTIDYTTHTYAVRIWTMGGSDLKDVEQAYLSNPATPESLQTSSWSQVVGTATIEDQPAYVLHQTGGGGFSSTLWVNKYTLLPIEEVNHTYLGKQTSTYSYATVTGASGTAAANLPAIPPGFTCTAAGHCDPTPGGSGN